MTYVNIGFRRVVGLIVLFTSLFTVENGLAQAIEQEAPTMDTTSIREDAFNANGFRTGNLQAGGMKLIAPGTMAAPTTLGATVGGAQDIGYARQLIESGRIPNFIDFSPEGLYSEHDIPTPATDCDEKLCLSLGYGFAPAADTKQPALFIHLGMTSGIKPEDFRRPNLQLAVVIDKSGSMKGASMNAVKQALRSLVEKLDPEDVLTLIAFNDNPELLLKPTEVKDKKAIIAAIESLDADGGTNIETGLISGFSQLINLSERKGYQKRVMLFTDARPNIGRTDSGSFRTITEKYANQGIGLTAFGVGLDFGQELIYHISQLRGGNFFFLETPDKIARVFEKEFDYLVTPVVYDLRVNVKTPEGMKLVAVYGLPTWKPGDRDAELHVPTVFFSSNRGAIILRYERDDDSPLAFKRGDLLADGSLSYTDVNGKSRKTHAELRHEAKMSLKPGVQFYTHEGMRIAVALTNVYFGLRDGCTLFTEGKKEEALEAIARAQALVDLENITLFDAGLKEETALLEKLGKNIEQASVIDGSEGLKPFDMEKLPQR
ncbi:MAG: VWA domain-containing protein [Ignavibacteriae bacterium]|nr:VWA domain-containing protein [Ignavibacteriota bacterium]MCB9217604.1 VWA domain-containing protein [Ignavibacteria bacterium]